MGSRRLWIGILTRLVGLAALALVVLYLNNRTIVGRYIAVENDRPELSLEEIEAAGAAYSFLEGEGDSILPGLGRQDIDLILYNEAYEFLFSRQETGSGWEEISRGILPGRNLYRREAEDPESFAVFIKGRWVARMATMDHYNKTMTKMAGLLLPPQYLLFDEAHYRGIVVHEMVHAFQGHRDSRRLWNLSILEDIAFPHHEDKAFVRLIREEGAHLDKAIRTTRREEVLQHIERFLLTRQERRRLSGMDTRQILEEKDFEWLEGLARYAEYRASEGSESFMRRHMAQIEDSVWTGDDDRYYTLGMAQAMALDLLDPQWKADVFHPDFLLEDRLAQLVRP